ncbi:MAG: hypothetical protein ABI634_20110 [Acidobacteriota bacterium]
MRTGTRAFWKSADTRTFWVPVVALAAISTVDPFIRLGSVRFAQLSGFQDDFFYYLTIARNLAEHGRSTFDGVSLTNGYHPLWEAVLTLLARLAPAGSVTFVALLMSVVFGLILLSAVLMRRMALSTWPDAPVSVDLGSLIFVFACAQLARTGMETVIAIPAILAALVSVLACADAPSPRRYFVAAVCCSLAVLSRIDAAIFVALLVTIALAFGAKHRVVPAAQDAFKPRILASIALGALPLVGYIAVNYAIFGTLIPQSGAAKQIRSSASINGRVWEFLLAPRKTPSEFVYFFLVGTMPFVLAVAGCTRVAIRHVPPRARIVMLSLGGFTLVYYAVLSVISDWSLWIWYLYPAATAGGPGAVLLFSSLESRLPRRLPQLTAIALVLIAAAGVMGRRPASNRILGLGVQIAEFATTHRAGTRWVTWREPRASCCRRGWCRWKAS